MDRRVKPRRITWGRVLTGVVVLGALGAGGYGYVRYGLARTLSVAAERVTISSVHAAPFSDYAPVTGNVAPENTVYLDAVQGGQVTDVLAEEGAQVKAGDLLARLRNTSLEISVLNLQAQIAQQENYLAQLRLQFKQAALAHQRDLMGLDLQIDQTKDQLARNRPLLGGAATEQAIKNLDIQLASYVAQKAVVVQAKDADAELAQSTLSELEGQIKQMTASLGLVQGSLNDLALTASITGQLTVFDLNVGQVVPPGQRIGQVDAIGSFKIVALVDEFYLGRIAIGQGASVEIGGKTYPLQVAKVFPNVRDRQFEVDLRFAGKPPEGLRRGQTLRPKIELGETANSLVLPNGPFYDETGGLWVLVVTPDGATATRRNVTLGRRNPEMVEILSGLAAGERVVTSSYQAFGDADRIEFK
jgi:HlyD family secretion protein